MDYLSSMYIDDELDLNEKTQFVDKIRSEQAFYQDTRELIIQEKLLREVPDTSMLVSRPLTVSSARSHFIKILKPMLYASAGFAAAALLLFSLVSIPEAPPHLNRFVIYEPTANRVELAGSFTGWQRRAMNQLGGSGYWELVLQISSGEHRFAYFLDGSRQIADPTLPTREMDDFGGMNSILNVEERV